MGFRITKTREDYYFNGQYDIDRALNMLIMLLKYMMVKFNSAVVQNEYKLFKDTFNIKMK